MNRSIVALIKCSSYAEDEVHSAVKRGIDLLGGISQFAEKNETILLKPNALNASNPDKCVITNLREKRERARRKSNKAP